MKKIYIACSEQNYYAVYVKKALEAMNYQVFLPSFFGNTRVKENISNKMECIDFYRKSFLESLDKIRESDAVLVLNSNEEQDGIVYENYIDGTSFLGMYTAYLLGHPVFLYNPIPDNILKEEIERVNPIILGGNVLKLRYHLDNPFSKYFCFEDYLKIKKCDDPYLKSGAIVRALFKDKKDKMGKPYLGHLVRVSNNMSTLEGNVLGLLHDTVEDISDIDFLDLEKIGISESILQALRLVTKTPILKEVSKEEKLALYNKEIDRIIDSGNDLALELKISDMSDNFDPKRLDGLSQECQDWFCLKYGDNLKRLKKEREKRK